MCFCPYIMVEGITFSLREVLYTAKVQKIS